MCRLVCTDYTIQIRKHCKKQHHEDVQAYPMDEDTIAMLNAPHNALIGNLFISILWDQLYGSKLDMSKMHMLI
jgi:hypothetical protein